MTPPSGTRSEEVTLLPCPFCGETRLHTDALNDGKHWWVWCPRCVTEGPNATTEAEAIAAWNRRATPAPIPSQGSGGGAIDDIAAERRRQIEVEGWYAGHDDGHTPGEMARAAACYAILGDDGGVEDHDLQRRLWPWEWAWWKPKDRRRNLVRAGALIAAEIDRLDRASSPDRTRTDWQPDSAGGEGEQPKPGATSDSPTTPTREQVAEGIARYCDACAESAERHSYGERAWAYRDIARHIRTIEAIRSFAPPKGGGG